MKDSSLARPRAGSRFVFAFIGVWLAFGCSSGVPLGTGGSSTASGSSSSGSTSTTTSSGAGGVHATSSSSSGGGGSSNASSSSGGGTDGGGCTTCADVLAHGTAIPIPNACKDTDGGLGTIGYATQLWLCMCNSTSLCTDACPPTGQCGTTSAPPPTGACLSCLLMADVDGGLGGCLTEYTACMSH